MESRSLGTSPRRRPISVLPRFRAGGWTGWGRNSDSSRSVVRDLRHVSVEHATYLWRGWTTPVACLLRQLLYADVSEKRARFPTMRSDGHQRHETRARRRDGHGWCAYVLHDRSAWRKFYATTSGRFLLTQRSASAALSTVMETERSLRWAIGQPSDIAYTSSPTKNVGRPRAGDRSHWPAANNLLEPHPRVSTFSCSRPRILGRHPHQGI